MEKGRREKIRNGVMFISMVLFPAVFYYFSPYLIIKGLAEGVVAGSCIMFLIMFGMGIFFGRGFCGWICPAGALQDMEAPINSNRNKRGWRRWIKYIIWIPWITTILFFIMKNQGRIKIDPFYETWHGISVVSPNAIIIYYGVAALIVIPAMIGGRRGFCHSLCWMAPFMQGGILVRKILRLPGIVVEGEEKRCSGCGSCTKVCIMSMEVEKEIVGKNGSSFECSLCGKCIEECKSKVLKYKVRRG